MLACLQFAGCSGGLHAQEADGSAYLVRSTDAADGTGLAISALTADYLNTRHAAPQRAVPAYLLPI